MNTKSMNPKKVWVTPSIEEAPINSTESGRFDWFEGPGPVFQSPQAPS